MFIDYTPLASGTGYVPSAVVTRHCRVALSCAHRAADGVSPLRLPSLTPSRVSALRASRANPATGCVTVGWLLFPSPYHAVLVVNVCAPCPAVVCLRPDGAPPIVNRLNAENVNILESPEFQDANADIGAGPAESTPKRMASKFAMNPPKSMP